MNFPGSPHPEQVAGGRYVTRPAACGCLFEAVKIQRPPGRPHWTIVRRTSRCKTVQLLDEEQQAAQQALRRVAEESQAHDLAAMTSAGISSDGELLDQ
jgi:hypothetical protein